MITDTYSYLIRIIISVAITRQTPEGAWRAVSTMVEQEPRSRCMALQSDCCEQSWPPLFLPRQKVLEDLQSIFKMKDSPHWLFIQLYILVFFMSHVGLSLVGYVAPCDKRGRVVSRYCSVLRTSTRDIHARVQNNFTCKLGFWRLAIEDHSDRYETVL